MSTRVAEPTDTSIPLVLSVRQAGAGGVTGLSSDIEFAIRDGSTTDSYLDFDDNTFKTSGWTTKYNTTITEIERGHYQGSFNANAVAAILGGFVAVVEWNLDDGGDNVADAHDVLVFFEEAYDLASEGDIVALNDLSVADVQTALTAQGYTVARAPNLDDLDVAVSTRAVPGDDMGLTAGAVADVADGAWDEPAADHVAPGTMGGLQNSPAVDAATIAGAVWDEAAADHTAAGSMGLLQQSAPAVDPATIADAVLEELVSDHEGIPGSLAAVIREIRIEVEEDDFTVEAD